MRCAANYQQLGREIRVQNPCGRSPSTRLSAVCRSLVAMLLLLGAIGLSAATARADSFNVTFFDSTLTVVGTGTLTTNGVCAGCLPGTGLLTFFVNLGADSGASAFDITDDNGAAFTVYNRPSNTIGAGLSNSETGDGLSMQTGPTATFVFASADGRTSLNGTYVVAPNVPEPRSITLFLTGLALVGLFHRRKLLASAAN